MMWLHHLDLSPFCQANHAVVKVNGRDVCQCGWMGPKDEKPFRPGVTFARLDADRQAKPKTRLLGHAPFGHCVSPATTPADTLENTETGERTSLGYDESDLDDWYCEPDGYENYFGR